MWRCTRHWPGAVASSGRGGRKGLSSLGPAWLAAGLFAVATLLLFAEFIFSDKMLYGADTLGLGYMIRAEFAERLAAGEFPLWGTRLLGGIPWVESIAAGDSLHPASLLYFLFEPYRALGWKLVLHVFAAGLGMYGWCRSLGLAPAAAVAGGLAWLLAPAMVTQALPGGDGKLMVAAATPFVFWAADAVTRHPSAPRMAGMAGSVAVVCLTTHFQTAYFLFLSAGVYALARAAWAARWSSARRPAVRGVGAFALASVLGAGVAAVQLLPAASYVTEFSRRTATTVEADAAAAREYSGSWSLHPEEAAGLVVPEFVGASSGDSDWARGTYWGRNPFKLNHEYAGVVVLAVGVFALFAKRRRELRWFLASMSAVWLLYALGPHALVWRAAYELLPGISLFRAPSLSAFLVSFGATTLFALGADDLCRDRPSPGAFLRERRGVAVVAFAGGLLALLLLHAAGGLAPAWTALLRPGIDGRSLAALENASSHIATGLGLAVLLASLAAASAWAARNGLAKPRAAVAALAVLAAADLARVDRAFITTLDFHAWARPDANARFLQERLGDGAPFRVAEMNEGDQSVTLAMFGIDLLGGHHPNDLASYRKLLGLQASQERGAHTRHPNILRMANVKYLIWPDERAGGPPFEGAERLSAAPTASGQAGVYAFPGLDRAWVVGAAPAMEDDRALARILSRDFDPAREAILADGAPVEAGDVAGSVEWILAEPARRRLRVESDGPGLLVVSENWLPGWTAEVGGRPAPVRRANIAFQAVELPGAGVHDVELRYGAPAVRSALKVTAASVAALLLLLAAPWAGRLRPRSRRSPPA